MPSYNFRCEDCGTNFQKHFHMHEDKSHVSCPNCGSQATSRVYSAPLVEFKGKGFYVTDSRSKSAAASGN